MSAFSPNGYGVFSRWLNFLNQIPPQDVWDCMQMLGQDAQFHEILRNYGSHLHMMNLLTGQYLPAILGQMITTSDQALKESLIELDQFDMSVLLSQVSDYYTPSTKESLQSHLYTTYSQHEQFVLKEHLLYGSERIGTWRADSVILFQRGIKISGYDTTGQYIIAEELYRDSFEVDTVNLNLRRGFKNYELTNHLGNVQATITDHRIPSKNLIDTTQISYYQPHFSSATDYYPFGMMMSFGDSVGYGFGFQGQEVESEIAGVEGAYSFFKYRISDNRLGRFFAVDPKGQFLGSQYSAFANNATLHIDPDGGWIPGVDENGNIILTAEKGDNVSTLIDFFGSEESAIKHIHLSYICKNIKSGELQQANYKVGRTVRFNQNNLFSVSINDAFENSNNYVSFENWVSWANGDMSSNESIVLKKN